MENEDLIHIFEDYKADLLPLHIFLVNEVPDTSRAKVGSVYFNHITNGYEYTKTVYHKPISRIFEFNKIS